MKTVSPFKLPFWIIVVIFSSVSLEASEDIKFIEKVTSLGSVPQGYELVQNSLKYSPDFKHVSYVTYPDEKHMYVRLNNKTSAAYLAVRPGFPVFGPSNRHAYIAYKDTDRSICVVDWQPGPEFENIDQFLFSPDGNHYAYRAEKMGKQCIVVDGLPGPFYDGIPVKNNMKFSPDSSHFVYTVFTGKDCAIILDNNRLNPAYNFIQDVIFSPDSNHFAFKARIEKTATGEKWQVIRDGKPGTAYNKIFDLVYSYDSNHLAYAAVKDRHMILVIDDEEKPGRDLYGFPTFSPDSETLAYTFVKDSKYQMVINDKEDGFSFDGIFKFYYSLDSSRFAYIADKDKQWFLVCDNKKSPGYKLLDGFQFSPDSSHFAYCAVNNDDKGLIVIDGKPQKTYTKVGQPYFSPDSKHLVYKAIVNNENNEDFWTTIIDDEDQKQYYLSIGRYFFSPDSRHIAYRAMKLADQLVVVVDKKEEFADRYLKIVGDPYFSPDSNHVAYHAMLKAEEWKMIVDGHLLNETYAGFIKTTPIIYDTNNHFHTIGIRTGSDGIRTGSEFALIEVDIPESSKLESRFK